MSAYNELRRNVEALRNVGLKQERVDEILLLVDAAIVERGKDSTRRGYKIGYEEGYEDGSDHEPPR